MKPIEFEEQNKILTKPEGWTDEQCISLHCFCDDERVISRWQMTWRERLIALFTGKMWVSVISGRTSPPILPMFDSPFEKIPKWKRPLRFKDLADRFRGKA